MVAHRHWHGTILSLVLHSRLVCRERHAVNGAARTWRMLVRNGRVRSLVVGLLHGRKWSVVCPRSSQRQGSPQHERSGRASRTSWTWRKLEWLVNVNVRSSLLAESERGRLGRPQSRDKKSQAVKATGDCCHEGQDMVSNGVPIPVKSSGSPAAAFAVQDGPATTAPSPSSHRTESDDGTAAADDCWTESNMRRWKWMCERGSGSRC